MLHLLRESSSDIDENFYRPDLYSVVEMNGNIIPVEQLAISEHGVKYHIYNKKNDNDIPHPIEWDGNRWIFDSASSPHVSKEIRKKIKKSNNAVTYAVRKGIDSTQLSSSDHHGLRSDNKNNSYLKVNNNFFKVTNYSDNPDRFYIRTKYGKHNLRFKNGIFYSETISERIKNIKEVGLNSKERRPSVDILIEQAGFSRRGATALLAEYDFPDSGFFDSHSFALDVAQNNEISAWSERFKYGSVTRINPVEIGLILGEIIGLGEEGIVFVDRENPGYVIKGMGRVDHEGFIINPEAITRQESELFRKYYGETSSNVFTDGHGNYFNMMREIPGVPLDSLPANSLPFDAVERYVDMLEKLNYIDVIHGDLNPENVMWDRSAKMFFPLDINNIKESFFRSNEAGKNLNNAYGEEEWDDIITMIREKINLRSMSHGPG